MELIQKMKKRLEQLMLMGILSICAVSTMSAGVSVYAEDTAPMMETYTEKETETEKTAQAASESESEQPVTEGTDESETNAPTTDVPETNPPESDTEQSTENVTEGESGSAAEKETETVTEWEAGSALDETVEIIDNSLDDEALAKIEAETKKKNEEMLKKKAEEEAKKLYEMKIGESMIDFNAYPAGNITENTNWIYNYLRNEMGLNHAAACGVLANIQCESNFAPTAIGDGGTSYGLCQWHLGRFSRLVSWCNENGYNYHLVEGQMRYLEYELTSLYVDVYDYIRQVPDSEQGAYDAAYYWCAHFEMPSDTIARSKQRGNMAMNEFFPRELGMADITAEEETVIEMNVLLDRKKDINLWDETFTYVYQMYRLNMPQEEYLILE